MPPFLDTKFGNSGLLQKRQSFEPGSSLSIGVQLLLDLPTWTTLENH